MKEHYFSKWMYACKAHVGLRVYQQGNQSSNVVHFIGNVWPALHLYLEERTIALPWIWGQWGPEFWVGGCWQGHLQSKFQPAYPKPGDIHSLYGQL